MLGNLGMLLSNQTRLLEFGCGEGKLVAAAAKRGIEAYGCDIDFSKARINQQALAELMTADRVRRIETVVQDNVEASSL